MVQVHESIHPKAMLGAARHALRRPGGAVAGASAPALRHPRHPYSIYQPMLQKSVDAFLAHPHFQAR